jgi:excisionase family DNA binding protein
MEERYLSLSEAADALDISERTAHRWIKSGKLRSYKPGRDHKIPESAIIEAIEAGEVRPKAKAPLSPEQSSFNGLLEEERRHRELEEIRESYREEREGVERYLVRWERWLETGGIPEEAVREFLVAAMALYPALRGLSISELTEISVVLRIDSVRGLTDEAKAQSLILPLVDRYWELGRKLTEVWHERFPEEEEPLDLEAMRREIRLRRAG